MLHTIQDIRAAIEEAIQDHHKAIAGLEKAKAALSGPGFDYSVDDHGHVELAAPSHVETGEHPAPMGLTSKGTPRKRRAAASRIPVNANRSRDVWDAMIVHGIENDWQPVEYKALTEAMGLQFTHRQAIGACLSQFVKHGDMVRTKMSHYIVAEKHRANPPTYGELLDQHAAHKANIDHENDE